MSPEDGAGHGGPHGRDEVPGERTDEATGEATTEGTAGPAGPGGPGRSDGPAGPVRGSGGTEGVDEDSAWAAIVAGYGERVLGDPEDDPEPPTASGPSGGPQPLTIFDRPTYDARRAWRRDAGVRADDRGVDGPGADDVPPEHRDSQDRYVPPEPPPLPRPRGAKGFAWVGVGGVPLLFLVLTLLDVRLVSGAGLLLLLWFIGSFGYLVGTMREDPGDGWDDGARV